MDAIRTVNDGLAFLLEIASLVALAVWGFTVGANLAVQLLLGLGAPAVLIAVWSAWLAPGSDNRLDTPWLVIVKVVVFGLAAVALAAARRPRLATILGVLAVVNLGVAVVLGLHERGVTAARGTLADVPSKLCVVVVQGRTACRRSRRRSCCSQRCSAAEVTAVAPRARPPGYRTRPPQPLLS